MMSQDPHNWLTRKLADDFWHGPMDVFLSWFRLNVPIEDLYTEEQLKAYHRRRGLVRIHNIEDPEEFVAWLNEIKDTHLWQLPPMTLKYKHQDEHYDKRFSIHNYGWQQEEDDDK